MKTKSHTGVGTVIGILLFVLSNTLNVGCMSTKWSSLYPRFGWWGEEVALDVDEENEMLTKVEKGAGPLFRKGYEYYVLEDYRVACQIMHQYMAEHTPNDVDYEWAEFFLGIGLN